MDNTDLFIAAKVFSCNENGTYSIPYTPEDVFAALKTILPKIQGFKVTDISDFGKSLNIKVGMSWKSWGETIKISVLPSSANDSMLSIMSKSNMGLIDYGKNIENVNSILEALQNELCNYKEVGPNVQRDAQKDDPADKLVRLKTLFDNEIISAEEYESKKAELLKRL